MNHNIPISWIAKEVGIRPQRIIQKALRLNIKVNDELDLEDLRKLLPYYQTSNQTSLMTKEKDRLLLNEINSDSFFNKFKKKVNVNKPSNVLKNKNPKSIFKPIWYIKMVHLVYIHIQILFDDSIHLLISYFCQNQTINPK